MSNLTRSLDRFEPSSLLALRQGLETEKRRRAAKTSLIAFTEHTYRRYEAAPIHRQIAEHLERVERGDIDRLMLLVPPRHGKSELASRRFPAWYLGRHPHQQFISASASITLAEDFGRDVRNLIASPEYAQVFDTQLAEDSQARGRWTTAEGASHFATGIGGALMGRGAHVLLSDDPFGSMADARSEIERKSVHEWFTGTCYNRLEKDGKIVLINHRMHQDDLSGRLLAQQAAGGRPMDGGRAKGGFFKRCCTVAGKVRRDCARPHQSPQPRIGRLSTSRNRPPRPEAISRMSGSFHTLMIRQGP
jgi:hypothetical protein